MDPVMQVLRKMITILEKCSKVHKNALEYLIALKIKLPRSKCLTFKNFVNLHIPFTTRLSLSVCYNKDQWTRTLVRTRGRLGFGLSRLDMRFSDMDWNMDSDSGSRRDLEFRTWLLLWFYEMTHAVWVKQSS